MCAQCVSGAVNKPDFVWEFLCATCVSVRSLSLFRCYLCDVSQTLRVTSCPCLLLQQTGGCSPEVGSPEGQHKTPVYCNQYPLPPPTHPPTPQPHPAAPPHPHPHSHSQSPPTSPPPLPSPTPNPTPASQESSPCSHT